MKRLEAIIRTERVDQVVAALRKAGVPRLTVVHVHALGSGVDPEDYRLGTHLPR
jgi:nitrogen regulatory protein PII